jgi:hypothetical protein
MTSGGRLFRKYVLWTMALVCGALLASGAISIYFSYQENKAALSLVQHEKAVAAAARIEQFIRQIEQQLSFAALPQLGAEEAKAADRIPQLIRQVPAVTDIAQIDSWATAIVGVAPGDGRGGQPARPFSGARVQGRAARPDLFRARLFRKETEPYMTIAVRRAARQEA